MQTFSNSFTGLEHWHLPL